MTAPARRAAFQALRLVHRGTAAADAQARTRALTPDPRDRSLATHLLLGTLRWRGRLDHALSQVSARPLRRLDPEVLDVLRLAAFQLLRLDRVPAHAVVDDAVRLVRRSGKASASPFVNAVLRRLGGTPPPFTLPSRPEPSADGRPAQLDFLSITGSHPRWLVERWLDRIGFEAAAAWVDFDNAPAPLTLCCDTRRVSVDSLRRQLDSEGVAAEPGLASPRALVVTRGVPRGATGAGDAPFWYQTEASQLVTDLVEAEPGHRVLDLCAAPGGKTRGLLSATDGQGPVVATDRSETRARALRDRLDLTAAHVVQADGRRPPVRRDGFDRVLVDAPCTGLGTLRRRPDIRWRRQPEDLARMASLQGELLTGAATTVAGGGRLVYATCTGEPEENEAVVEAFLADHPAFALRPPGPDHLRRFVNDAGYFRTHPPRDGLEAFFGAVLERKMP